MCKTKNKNKNKYKKVYIDLIIKDLPISFRYYN